MKLNNLLWLFILTALTLGFTSCDNDDSDNGGSGSIKLSQTEYPASGEGGQLTVTVTTSGNLAWEAKGDKGWVSVTDQTSSTFTIVVAEWDNYEEERTATVTVSANGARNEYVNITQYPKDFTATLEVLDKEDIEFEVRGGEVFVRVEANVVWTADTDANWIFLSKASDGSGFKVRTSANETPRGLEGMITVSSIEGVEPVGIKVTQDYIEPYLRLYDSNGKLIENLDISYNYAATLGMAVGEIRTNIKYDIEYTVTADANDDREWFIAADPYGEDYLYVQFDNENSTGQDRKATVSLVPKDADLDFDPVVINITQRPLNVVQGPRFLTGNDINLTANPSPVTMEQRLPAYTISLEEPETISWLYIWYDEASTSVIIEATPNGTTQARSGVVHAYVYPDDDSRGMTVINITQEGLSVAPEFGETRESLHGKYLMTATDVEGQTFQQTIDFVEHTYFPFDEEHAYSVVNFYQYVTPGGQTAVNPKFFLKFNQGAPIVYLVQPTDTNTNIGIPNGGLSTSGKPGWVMYDERGWINHVGQDSQDHIVNYAVLSDKIDYYPEAVIDPVAKTITFEADTFQWTSGMDAELQPYDGKPIYLAIGYSNGNFKPYKGINNIVLTFQE